MRPIGILNHPAGDRPSHAISLRHTYPISWGGTCSLRRPGTFGLIAGWGPAASDLTVSYEDVRTRLDGLSIVHSFRLTISVSRGAAINAIRDGPPGVIGSNRKSSGRSPPRRGTIVQPLTGLPEVSTTSGQRILARIKTVGFAPWSAQLFT